MCYHIQVYVRNRRNLFTHTSPVLCDIAKSRDKGTFSDFYCILEYVNIPHIEFLHSTTFGNRNNRTTINELDIDKQLSGS